MTDGIAFDLADHETINQWSVRVRGLGLRTHVAASGPMEEIFEIYSPFDIGAHGHPDCNTAALWRQPNGSYILALGDRPSDGVEYFDTVVEALDAIETVYRETLAGWELPWQDAGGEEAELVDAE